MGKLLCQMGPYGPYILHGQENRRNRRQAWGRKAVDFYEIIAIEDGSINFTLDGKRHRRAAPIAFIIQPEMEFELRVGRGIGWNRLVFDIVYQRKRFMRGDRNSYTHVGSKPQPTPHEIWGIDISAEVPAPLVRSCIDCVLWCNARYWRSPMHYLRCNERLGMWLLDFVEFVIGMEKPAEDDWLGQLTAFCRDQLCHGVTVAQLARQAGISRQHFRKKMLEACNKTPKQFIEEIKVDTASALLRASDLKVTEISRHCGYSSHAVFGRSFRRLTGLPPSEWRRKNRAGV